MLIGGFWHGANWTFLVWGAIHGLGLAVERWFGVARESAECSALELWMRRIIIFHLVCVAWVFFRAESIDQAAGFLAGVLVWNWRPEYAVAMTFLCAFALLQWSLDLFMERTGSGEYPFASRPLLWRVVAGVCAIIATTMFAGSQANAFIYFQF
jgi:alginate O-acetyltransferase complex protein AlgI